MDVLSLSAALQAISAQVSQGQLTRFARRVLGERFSLELERKQTTNSLIRQLVDRLIASGRLNDAVFDELELMAPGAKSLVESARSEWKADREQPASQPSLDVGESDEWVGRLRKRLESTPVPTSDPPPGLVEILALLPSFDAVHVIERLLDDADGLSSGDVLERLAAIADPRPDGRWVLGMDARRAALARLFEKDSQDYAISRAKHLKQIAVDVSEGRRRLSDEDDAYLSIFNEIFRQGSVRFSFADSDLRLHAARTISDWLADTPYAIDSDRVATLIEARERIGPLRRLVGEHFRGRANELAELRNASGFGPAKRRVLALAGVGGVGKSALLGRHILSLLAEEPPPPVAYIDFDRLEADPSDPRSLLEAIARSLSLIYADRESVEGFYALESSAAGDTNAVAFDPRLPAGVSLKVLFEAMNERIERLPYCDRTLIVFDTFEQVMRRGPAVLEAFSAFLKDLLGYVPSSKVILSGRGDIRVPVEHHIVRLVNLDLESADAVLEARGVRDEAIRAKIIETMGTSPLVLRIAAGAVLSGQLDPMKLDLFQAQAQGLRLHGVLYSRVLGHISDQEVQRLAHPGLVVRRVTPAVIREVLAEVCGLDPQSSEAIFQRLPTFSDLFEPDDSGPGEGSALRHRQDLREEVLDLMVHDPDWQGRVSLIHELAASYYSGRSDPVGRAEALYHNLMLDRDPEVLDELWSGALVGSLSRTWSDPMPERARAWLAVRLGLDDGTDRAQLRLIDWEVRTARAARSYLDKGDHEAALKLILERTERTPDSPAALVEIEARRAGHDFHGGLRVAEEALSRASSSHVPRYRLNVLLLAAEIASEANDADRARRFAAEAVELATALSDHPLRLRALELEVRRSHERASDLEQAFVAAPSDALRSDIDMVGLVIDSIGLDSSAVLTKAAVAFTRDPGLIFAADPRPWQTLFQTVSEQKGGPELLSSLAVRLGLKSGDIDPLRVATQALRTGLQSEVLSQVLGAYGGDETVRRDTVATFGAVSHGL